MNTQGNITGIQLLSEVTSGGELKLSLARVAIPEPAADEVIVRIEASPINPSDVGLLLGPADLATLKVAGTEHDSVVTAVIPPARMGGMAARLDRPMPVGNEGAGVVVRAGSEAQDLLGKTVAVLGGAMYAQYRTLKAAQCLVLPPGATAADGASAFVNPLTALGMVETMRSEGHTALVHTAAASNLGQMLNKICLKDNIGLVNIVRSADQTALLQSLGAQYICDSTAPTFIEDLTEALAATGATLAFDAIGGGRLGGQILACMEAVASRKMTVYSRYGSPTHKQLYIYGGLDPRPTEIDRSMGMTWGVGGWLVTSFLAKIAPEVERRLKARVAAELTTTFASRYAAEISLIEALQPDIIAAYYKRATGQKYLINPNKQAVWLPCRKL